MTPDATLLDDAIRAGAYRIGRANLRPVHCARCHAACLPSQARQVRLAAWAWRGVYLCVASCVPKGAR